MRLAEFPYLARQRFRAAIDCYKSTSLYHRNLGFFLVGIVGGSILGSYKRKVKEATNADCAAVHLTFYDLSAALAQQQKGHEQSSLECTARQLSLQKKRAFEKLWEEAARLLQRQPGYTYTQMFRRLPPDVRLQSTGLTHAEGEIGHRRTGRRGVSAGIEASTESDGAKQEERAVDYVELRVWENEDSRKKADMLQMPLLQKMRELGVQMDSGIYRRVFDDARVRLIQ